jgi:FPC/CPF motif-containing protein YcgG
VTRVEADAVRHALGAKLLGDQFACVAGKTSWLRDAVVHRHFDRLADPDGTTCLHAALSDFAVHKDDVDPLLATFVATFAAPRDLTEPEFETLLWRQLQALHDIDVPRFTWDPLVSPDPESPRFGFSIGGHGFFVVGLHANASRISRRFDHTTLVFNSHRQFEALKERGMYRRIRAQVREREMALQGSLNPNLSDFGVASETRQYSGRAVDADWKCPFQPTSIAQPTNR